MRNLPPLFEPGDVVESMINVGDPYRVIRVAPHYSGTTSTVYELKPLLVSRGAEAPSIFMEGSYLRLIRRPEPLVCTCGAEKYHESRHFKDCLKYGVDLC